MRNKRVPLFLLLPILVLLLAVPGCATFGIVPPKDCTEANSVIVKTGDWGDGVLSAMVGGALVYAALNPAAYQAIHEVADQAATALEGGTTQTLTALTNLYSPLKLVVAPLAKLVHFDAVLGDCDRKILAAYLRMI